MQRTIRKLALGAAAAMLATAAIVAPAAAASTEQNAWSDSYVVERGCGITEATTVTVRETVFFDGAGEWVRTIARLEFVGVFTGPTGATYASTSHQTAVVTPETVTLNGQGTFLRGAGGVLVMDAGHLTFEPGSLATLAASAKVILADDPEGPGVIDAALCAAIG